MSDLQRFALGLRRKLDELGWSMQECGRQTGVESSLISKYCRGLRPPGFINLMRILKATGGTLEELLQPVEELGKPGPYVANRLNDSGIRADKIEFVRIRS